MDLRDFIQFIKSQKLVLPHEYILLAVSGGVDSVVMADLFHRADYRFALAHCNFGLRGRESDEDEQFVASLARHYGVPFFSSSFETEAAATGSGDSIQMTARRLRYEWFERVRSEHGFDFIATGHHLDDQAETFLINLVRGTGIAGLHGIPVKNGLVVRPMLFAFRQDILEYAAANHLEYREDRSNRESKYLRNRIRNKVIPLLCEINPDFTAGLNETIRRLREFEKAGLHAVEEWQKNSVTREGLNLILQVENLGENHLAPILAWEFMSRFGFNETQLRNLLGSLNDESRKVFLSPTHRVVKQRGRLVISIIGEEAPGKTYRIPSFSRKKRIREPLPLVFEKITDASDYEIPATGQIASLDLGKINFPLTVRKWRHGDVFCPLGMKKKKKISDFLIDCKFSMQEKENTWVLCSGPDIAWIIGYRIDHRYRVTASTKEILRIAYIQRAD